MTSDPLGPSRGVFHGLLISLAILFGVTGCVLVTGCTTPTPPVPKVETVRVDVPVTRSCLPDNYDPTPPQFADSDEALRAAPGPAARYLLLGEGRAQRIIWGLRALSVLTNCK